jgi:uncharacterized protein RhaS with RHS repeats
MPSRFVVLLASLTFAVPAEARFLQADPVGVEAGPHLYAYAQNDPLNWTDPQGLDCVSAGGTTSCTTSAYAVSFQTPRGWQDFTSNSTNYHFYPFARSKISTFTSSILCGIWLGGR